MARSQESYNKKEVRNKKEKKRKEKEKKKLAKKDQDKPTGLDDMIAYVDANGNIVDTPPDPTEKVEIDIEDIDVSTPRKEKEEEMDPIRKGTLTHYNDSKGYGFIKDSETRESVFVHRNNMLEEADVNDVVSFEVEMGPKGPSAFNVKIFND